MSVGTGTHAAFFYGTLMHPKILRRVIGHEGDRLEICPAVLMVSQLDLQLILTARVFDLSLTPISHRITPVIMSK